MTTVPEERISLSSTLIPGGFEAFLEYCLPTGIRAIDIYYPKDVSLDNVSAIRQAVEREKLQTVGVSILAEMNRPGMAEKWTPLIIETIRAAAELGAPYVNTYFGANPALSTDEQIESYVRNIAPCLREAERLDVILLLENGYDWNADDPLHTDVTRHADLLAKLVRRVGSSHFSLTFDPTNFVMAGAEGFPHAYEILREVIGYVHVKDALRYDPAIHGERMKPGTGGSEGEISEDLPMDRIAGTGKVIWPDGRPGGSDPEFIYTTIGDGALNWDGLLRALNRDGYKGWFCLEPHAEPKDRVEVATKAVQYLTKPR